MHRRKYGIIFDMDNTLLHSVINFSLMKQRACEIMDKYGISHDASLSVSAMVNTAHTTEAAKEEIWREIQQIEDIGGKNAELEPGIKELLPKLHSEFILAILTNNTQKSAVDMLAANKIQNYFDMAAGRETVPEAKPSPAGYIHIMKSFPDKTRWLAIGDALIDAQGAIGAGIPFISYEGSRQENWANHGITPPLTFSRWDKETYGILRKFLLSL